MRSGKTRTQGGSQCSSRQLCFPAHCLPFCYICSARPAGEADHRTGLKIITQGNIFILNLNHLIHLVCSASPTKAVLAAIGSDKQLKLFLQLKNISRSVAKVTPYQYSISQAEQSCWLHTSRSQIHAAVVCLHAWGEPTQGNAHLVCLLLKRAAEKASHQHYAASRLSVRGCTLGSSSQSRAWALLQELCWVIYRKGDGGKFLHLGLLFFFCFFFLRQFPVMGAMRKPRLETWPGEHRNSGKHTCSSMDWPLAFPSAFAAPQKLKCPPHRSALLKCSR